MKLGRAPATARIRMDREFAWVSGGGILNFLEGSKIAWFGKIFGGRGRLNSDYIPVGVDAPGGLTLSTLKGYPS